LLARAGASGEVQPVISAGIDILHDVSQRARTCDIAHMAPDLRETTSVFHEAAHGILFHSPVGLMLNGDPLATRDRVFIAWDGGLAASSAVHAALPNLRAAEEVVVGCFDPSARSTQDGEDPGAGLAAWLSHHKCTVTLAQYPSGGVEIARCIRERAREAGADLVVMGAYGHSRWREAVFGGTTRTMMEQTDLPVLFAH
jgi:nucleotide-binding universal stress UspA family protein